MSDKEWDQIMEVHLKAAFACTKAAWPHFRKQKFGRVLNTASAAGLYGTYFTRSFEITRCICMFQETLAKQTTVPQRWRLSDSPRLLPSRAPNTVLNAPSSLLCEVYFHQLSGLMGFRLRLPQ
jgi:NAD(P)-dependent dehydrogenase (short-subunit alcohol dehydrogenase family)